MDAGDDHAAGLDVRIKRLEVRAESETRWRLGVERRIDVIADLLAKLDLDALCAVLESRVGGHEHGREHVGASAILDELVELAVRRSEVNVALLIVLGWIIDCNSGRSELDDRIVEVLDTEPDRTVGVTHAMWIGDSEVRAIWEFVQIRPGGRLCRWPIPPSLALGWRTCRAADSYPNLSDERVA
jgi:hypothetical protein